MLLLWIAIAAGLRFCFLASKSPWTDEFATLVFSLGNSFQNVPLDRAIAIDVLLQPLQPNPDAGIGEVVQRLLSEDTHPPLYFMLANLWLRLFPAESGLVSIWGARSLPAILGVISVPAIYAVTKNAFRSQLIAHLAAAMMAVSPYGIFISQEARHYTLAILWVIASLGCLVNTVRHIKERSPIPIWIVFTWIIINTLAISTHYFFILTLIAETVVLLRVIWQDFQATKSEKLTKYQLLSKNWWRIISVAAGTVAGASVWILVWYSTDKTQLTQWIKTSSFGILQLINPLAQSFAAWVTMLFLLPIESPHIPVIIASILVMLLFFIWATPILIQGLKLQLRSENQLPTLVFSHFVVAAIAIFLAISYSGRDITRGARYYFVYFPAVIILIGASLAICWNNPKEVSLFSRFKISGKQAVAIVLLMGFCSGVTVVSNLGYQKYYRPDLMLPIIEKNSQNPVLIATTHRTLVETGEMMGLAWEFKRKNSSINPQFLLAHQETEPKTSTIALQKTLEKMPRSLDLWLMNFNAPLELNNRCVEEKSPSFPYINGYGYKLYRCRQTI